MSTSGRATLQDIFAMLDECAPGHIRKAADHHWRVFYQGRAYLTLPKGEHGKREGRAEIERGHIRKMVRALGIEECARRTLAILAG